MFQENFVYWESWRLSSGRWAMIRPVHLKLALSGICSPEVGYSSTKTGKQRAAESRSRCQKPAFAVSDSQTGRSGRIFRRNPLILSFYCFCGRDRARTADLPLKESATVTRPNASMFHRARTPARNGSGWEVDELTSGSAACPVDRGHGSITFLQIKSTGDADDPLVHQSDPYARRTGMVTTREGRRFPRGRPRVRGVPLGEPTGSPRFPSWWSTATCSMGRTS